MGTPNDLGRIVEDRMGLLSMGPLHTQLMARLAAGRDQYRLVPASERPGAERAHHDAVARLRSTGPAIYLFAVPPHRETTTTLLVRLTVGPEGLISASGQSPRGLGLWTAVDIIWGSVSNPTSLAAHTVSAHYPIWSTPPPETPLLGTVSDPPAVDGILPEGGSDPEAGGIPPALPPALPVVLDQIVFGERQFQRATQVPRLQNDEVGPGGFSPVPPEDGNALPPPPSAPPPPAPDSDGSETDPECAL
jgi:hypothetical protein